MVIEIVDGDICLSHAEGGTFYPIGLNKLDVFELYYFRNVVLKQLGTDMPLSMRAEIVDFVEIFNNELTSRINRLNGQPCVL